MRKLPMSNSSLSAMFRTSVASKPPTTEPITPSRIVNQKPMACRPGLSNLANAPTKRPQIAQDRMPMA
jgi:hypothetical protein